MKVLKKAELRLWVYGGDIQNPPETPNYILTKTKLKDDTTIVFEIAELIKDFIEVKFDGDYNTLVQSKWVKYYVERTYEDTEVDTDGDGIGDLTTTNYSVNAIALRGYGENIDGINPELSKDVLMSNTIIHNKCGQHITFPLYTNGDGVVGVQYYQDSLEIPDTDLTLGSSDRFSIAQSIHVNPPLDDIITIDKTASQTVDSDNSFESVDIPINTNEVQFTRTDGTIGVIPVECIDECKHPHHKVSFINKFGVMQDIWFFAKRTDSMTNSRERYKRTKLDTSNGVNYSISAHQNVYLENQGKEKFTMNTGFIHRSYNEVIKQLLVSEYVFMYDKSKRSPTNFNEHLAIPVTVASSDINIKTRLNDKLIEYTLEFEADSDFIQSVR